ncbi:MAG TPA: GreA/GreB family elongation factor [Ramlibacter sp.]|nr:GreA/GreB family elongation factor [Ramlibacter sp.]
MPKLIHGERKLTGLDFSRLVKLAMPGQWPALAELLGEADVVDSRQVPRDVVTMYAQVMIEELKSRRRQTLVVCYPDDAEPSIGYISVLSPVGLALIGLPLGAVARWQTPGGDEIAAEVMAILFQPEATGDYVT